MFELSSKLCKLLCVNFAQKSLISSVPSTDLNLEAFRGFCFEKMELFTKHIKHEVNEKREPPLNRKQLTRMPRLRLKNSTMKQSPSMFVQLV